MDYKINHQSDVEKEVEISFSAQEVDENLSESLAHLSKTVNIKGFRKGKVPINVVKQFYGKSVKEEAEKHFISTGFRDTITKENLKFATEPEIFEKEDIKEGTPFNFKYRVEIFPSIEVELKEYEAEYSPVKFEEKMIEMELKAIKERFIEYSEDAESETAENDKLTINFSGTKDGEAVEGTEGKDVEIIIGSGKFLPDFENALIGKKQGGKFDAPVNFPEDYNAKDLAGSTIDFSFEITKVEKYKGEPELTDEFLKEKDGYPDSVDELKQELEKQIKQYLDNVNLQNKKYVACNTYIENHEFPVPPTVLKKETEVRINDYKQKNKVDEVPAETIEKLEKDALWVTKKYLVLGSLSEKLSIEVTEKEIDALLAQEAARYGLPPEYAPQLRNYYGEEGLANKKMEIKESKVLDKIVEKMKFIEKEVETKES
jgi:trigger factor